LIQKERLKVLKGGQLVKGKYILYWMQASQRSKFNHALEFAVREANNSNLPSLVYFGLYDKFPDANIRHFRFMLEGLKQTADNLKSRGINFIIRKESPVEGVIKLSKDAALTVFDAGYMPIQKSWRSEAVKSIASPVIQVEGDVIVPVECASEKEEYAAYTIRPKIKKHLEYFMRPLKEHEINCKTKIEIESVDISDPEKLSKSLDIDQSISIVQKFHPGGASKAQERLKQFISQKLSGYTLFRNDPSKDFQSDLSPYIHFGQISTLQIALEVKKSGIEDTEDFLEELIVRRELAMNFANYNSECQSYSALPSWAKDTLAQHEQDPRQYIYSLQKLENAETDDPYWNAAQKEMLITGKMHGYMRMYWGKMILQWSPTPEEAFKRALYLNDKYELDGRDPNSCTGIAWCFGKHDRAWPSHQVVGKVRLMNQNGLKRKFDIEAYVEKINSLS
jgi:deoxyribodipyrimidine photo-lyase